MNSSSVIKKILLGLVILGGLWVLINARYFIRFPKIVSHWYAKEYCSCRFVVERSPEQCHELVRQWIPISKVEEDLKEKTVMASGLGWTAKAVFEGEPFGCRLSEEYRN